MVDLKALEEWDRRIAELAQRLGLKCYPQEFEICDHFEMLGYMAYSGMPSRYPHWSFGKSYEREKTLYDYGVGGLPYEMVINSNPCLAYLMRDNTQLLQVLTIAHVYGHNDFFANNFTFRSSVDAKYTIEMFKNHANRIRSYIEDPSIGQLKVERFIDAAHSLSLQRSRNMAVRKLKPDEVRRRMWEAAQPKIDEFQEINPPQKYVQPDLAKNPPQPDPDILLFIADNNPSLESWQKDILHIIDKETQYFMPQIETKIMNEGWASYWHHKILGELDLPQGFDLEFMVRHNQVIRPTPGGLNPYHLGFVIWNDIEKRWNEGRTGQDGEKPPAVEISSLPETETPGRRKIFEVRETDRDSSFLRRFLTEEIMRELDIFQHEKRGKERVITKVADEESWQDIKNSFIRSVGLGSLPVIHVTDADFGHRRCLYLKHEYDERELLLDYAKRTLEYAIELWGREVVLETVLSAKPSLLRIADDQLKIERL